MAKLFTRIINNHLNDWAEEHGKFHDKQAGFRKGYGTSDKIYILQAFVQQSVKTGHQLYMCYLNFEKAFDYVDHLCMWYKVKNLGIKGRVLSTLRAKYKTLLMRVRHFDGREIESFAGTWGVRQGETLSPFLFACVLHDMENYILK